MRRTAWAAALLLAASCETVQTPRNEPVLARADDLFLREQYSQAAGHYEMFLSDNPEHPRRAELWARAGKCYLAAGSAEKALASLDRALAAQPSASVRADALFRKGIAHRVLGDVPKALEAFRATAAATIGDRDAAGITSDELAFETAQAKFRAGDWSAGQADLAKVTPQGPFGAKARVRLGLTGYVVQIGAFADDAQAKSTAAKVAEASVRVAPGSPPLHVVSVGPYARYENALAEAERLRASGFRDAFVIP
jgi:tetratricopeptide (TPR) repeat protein